MTVPRQEVHVPRDQVFAAIDRERTYQSNKWGGQPRTVQEWLLIIEQELAEAKLAWVKSEKIEEALCEILQIAACCTAACEQNGLHERTKI
jgi:hypothetical protein